MKVRVFVSLKNGVLDPQGRAIHHAIEALGYAGHIGCEYKPAAGTIEGLGWMKRLTA